MNKIQLIIMWLGIALFLLVLSFPPKKTIEIGFISPVVRTNESLQRTLLVAILLVIVGLIVTFRDKKKADKVSQWLTKNCTFGTTNKKPIDKQTDKKLKDEQN